MFLQHFIENLPRLIYTMSFFSILFFLLLSQASKISYKNDFLKNLRHFINCLIHLLQSPIWFWNVEKVAGMSDSQTWDFFLQLKSLTIRTKFKCTKQLKNTKCSSTKVCLFKYVWLNATLFIGWLGPPPPKKKETFPYQCHLQEYISACRQGR